MFYLRSMGRKVKFRISNYILSLDWSALMATHRVSPLVLMGLALAICSHFSDLPMRDEPKVKTKATILIILAELYVMAFAFMDKQTWTFERKRSVSFSFSWRMHRDFRSRHHLLRQHQVIFAILLLSRILFAWLAFLGSWMKGKFNVFDGQI